MTNQPIDSSELETESQETLARHYRASLDHVGILTWFSASHEQKNAFLEQIKHYRYGTDAVIQAWHWFERGCTRTNSDIDKVAEAITTQIFDKVGRNSSSDKEITRIEFKTGNWSDGSEKAAGGLARKPFQEAVKAALADMEKDNDSKV